VLAADRERLPAGRNDPHPRRRGQDGGDDLGGRSEHVLAVVDNKQELPVGQVAGHEVKGGDGTVVAQPEGFGGRAEDTLLGVHLGQPHEPGAVREPPREPGRRPQRQPRLADSARPDQADQPRGRQPRPELGELAASTDEATGLCGKVSAVARGRGHTTSKPPVRRGLNARLPKGAA
jgi:hypothetical protein